MSKTSNNAKLQCLKAYLYQLHDKRNYQLKKQKTYVVTNPNIKF